jgi:hypothetical protein
MQGAALLLQALAEHHDIGTSVRTCRQALRTEQLAFQRDHPRCTGCWNAVCSKFLAKEMLKLRGGQAFWKVGLGWLVEDPHTCCARLPGSRVPCRLIAFDNTSWVCPQAGAAPGCNGEDLHACCSWSGEPVWRPGHDNDVDLR